MFADGAAWRIPHCRVDFKLSFSRNLFGFELVALPSLSRLSQANELLIGQNADQNDRPHYREIQGARYAEQIHEILQHLQ